MNKWVKFENKIINKDSVTALEYQPETDQREAVLKVHLLGGSAVTLTDADAIAFWNEFGESIKEQPIQVKKSKSFQTY